MLFARKGREGHEIIEIPTGRRWFKPSSPYPAIFVRKNCEGFEIVRVAFDPEVRGRRYTVIAKTATEQQAEIQARNLTAASTLPGCTQPNPRKESPS